MNGQVLDFGFDGLGILPDGRFYATRGSGYAEVYRVNPTTGEVRLQDLTLEPSITGGLNGLDAFVEPSDDPPPPVDIGVKDTFLRKDKSGKSAKSGKSTKSEASNKSKASKKSKKSNKKAKNVQTPDNRHTNEGANPRLEFQKDQEVLVAFDVGDLDFSTVGGAQVIFMIDPDYGSTGWRVNGVNADIHHLKSDFVEGNGINTGPEAEQYRGDDVGATWHCSSDQDIANNEGDCAKKDKWQGAKKRGKRGRSCEDHERHDGHGELRRHQGPQEGAHDVGARGGRAEGRRHRLLLEGRRRHRGRLQLRTETCDPDRRLIAPAETTDGPPPVFGRAVLRPEAPSYGGQR